MNNIEEAETAIRAALEPETALSSLGSAGMLSLAISMKRIADQICGSPDRLGITESIRDAIETAIFNATRR